MENKHMKIDHSYNAVATENAIASLWKTICQFLIKLHMQPPHNPAIILLDIYPREMKIMFPQKAIRECSQQLYL